MLSPVSIKKLKRELDAWDVPATLWWRDDDAIADTQALRTLRSLSVTHAAPIALAVIPAEFDASLIELVVDWPLVDVCQHGFAHVNHAPAAEKKAELGDHRDARVVLDELQLGQMQLRNAFGARFTPVLVPPWNRLGERVRKGLPTIQQMRLSTFKARVECGDTVTSINTHVDIVDWRGTRGFVGEDAAVTALIDHLSKRRLDVVDAQEPTGILTHHLDHDAACWQFLDDLYAFVGDCCKLALLRPSLMPWSPKRTDAPEGA